MLLVLKTEKLRIQLTLYPDKKCRKHNGLRPYETWKPLVYDSPKGDVRQVFVLSTIACSLFSCVFAGCGPGAGAAATAAAATAAVRPRCENHVDGRVAAIIAAQVTKRMIAVRHDKIRVAKAEDNSSTERHKTVGLRK